VPIKLVKEDTPGAAVVAVKRVNETDFYFPRSQWARISKLSPLVAQDARVDPSSETSGRHDYFKEIGSVRRNSNGIARSGSNRLKEGTPWPGLEKIWASSKK